QRCVFLDFAGEDDVARRRLGLERPEAAAQVQVGRRRRKACPARVRDLRADPQLVAVAEAEVADRDRDSERRLAAEGDGEDVAVELDLRLLDEPLVAFDEDERFLAVDRLDVDVPGRQLDVELDRPWSVKAVLGHLRSPERWRRGGGW